MNKSLISGICIGLLLLFGCVQQTEQECDTISKPSVKIICRETATNTLCYAYPIGDEDVKYRAIGYQNDGEVQDWGEISSGGSVNVGFYDHLSYVEVFPNLNGKFCKDQKTKVTKQKFTTQ